MLQLVGFSLFRDAAFFESYEILQRNVVFIDNFTLVKPQKLN